MRTRKSAPHGLELARRLQPAFGAPRRRSWTADQFPESEQGGRTKVEELLKSNRDLSKDIHSLSHQLHSSKLEHVGLGSALKSLCRAVQHRVREITVKSRPRSPLRDFQRSRALSVPDRAGSFKQRGQTQSCKGSSSRTFWHRQPNTSPDCRRGFGIRPHCPRPRYRHRTRQHARATPTRWRNVIRTLRAGARNRNNRSSANVCSCGKRVRSTIVLRGSKSLDAHLCRSAQTR